jgi:hypothetical protein
VTGQLSLFDPLAELRPNGRPERDLRAQVRELVAEPGLSDPEVDALVEDALEQLADSGGWRAEEVPVQARAAPCQCERSVVFHTPGLGPTCVWCGRRP